MSDRYDIILDTTGVHTLMRHGEVAIPNDGLPTNAEYQFWSQRDDARVAAIHAVSILRAAMSWLPSDKQAEFAESIKRLQQEREWLK